MNARKVSASVPAEQYKAVERARRQAGLKRSQVIQEALAIWLRTRAGDERLDRYIEGYLRVPEDKGDARAYARVFSRGLPREDWS